MRVIYKYPLALAAVYELHLPRYARILDIQFQNGQPMLWAEANPEQPLVLYRVHCVGTGCTPPDQPFPFRGTRQDGPFVWHFYAGPAHSTWSHQA